MPWQQCAPCDVRWQGFEPCWACGAPGAISDPPRVQTYAVLTERDLAGVR